MSVIAAHVEGLRRGVGKDELGEVLARAAEDALNVCLPILEEKAGLVGTDENMDHMRQMNTSTLPEFEGWKFLVSSDKLWRGCPLTVLQISDPQFNLAGTESWLFNDENMQDVLLW